MSPLSGANASIRAQRQPRAFERHVAEIEPHRPRLGDLLDLVEIARGAGPVADAAAEGGAGEEAAGDVIIVSGGAQAVDGFVGAARRRCVRRPVP